MTTTKSSPAMIRWFLFILVGYPFHIVTMILYPLLHLYWRLVVFQFTTPLKQNPHQQIQPTDRHSAIRDGVFHDNQDDHGAFTHWGLFITDEQKGYHGLRLLIGDDGNFLRRYTKGLQEGFHVSGDTVVSWYFAAALYSRRFQVTLKEFILKGANHYLKHLGTLSNMPEAEGWVSTRCNNFGVNYCPDGAGKLGQPCAGPQFYSSSAVFALASQHSKKFKVIFWLHWIFMGGWFWAFSPVLYTKNWKGWYVREITMKALYVHLLVFGPRWWITKPMDFITHKIAESQNDLFYAMMGWNLQRDLPEVMNPFFAQTEDAVSRDDEKSNIWIAPGIKIVKEEARWAAK